jgi:hypothetical protein
MLDQCTDEEKMTNWIYFPKSQRPPNIIYDVVKVFHESEEKIEDKGPLTSNDVLALIRPKLEKIGFAVESGKKANEKIKVPVLFGRNGRVEKSFEVDAWNKSDKMVIEVEAGRGYLNNQFLKDLFQACMMHDIDYCGIAVRNLYIKTHDYENVVGFFETLYASNRLVLPLKGVLIIGY